MAASAAQSKERSSWNGETALLPTSIRKEDDKASTIIVTGSRIPRADLSAVSPVTMVDGQEIKLQGATTIEESLKQLPQVNPSQDVFAPPGATGAATIDLRGLGAVRTLVLVNGHRLVPGDPRYPVADINSIPTSIVRRVEVLTGGAAAVYGSDAVAGVVNFILDTKIDGFRVEAQIGAYQHNNRDKFAQGLLDQRQFPFPNGSVLDGSRGSVSMAFGRSFLDDRAHLTLYGGYRRITGVNQDQRDYGACPITAKMTGPQLTTVLECGGPIVSYPGNFLDNLRNIYLVTPDRTFVPGLSRFNYAPWHYIQRPDERYTAGGFATFEFSKAIQAYAEVMAMKDRTVWQVGPSGDFRNTDSINCDNPLLSDQQRSLICRTGNFIGEIPVFDGNGNLATIIGSPTPFVDPATGNTYNRAHLLISLRNIESESIQDDLRHNSIRLLGGFKGDLGRGVSYDASFLSSRVVLNRHYRNNFSITRLGRALDVASDPSTGQPICRSALIARDLGPSAPDADANCVPWDVFAPGQVTPQAIAYLSIPPSMRGSFSERVANVNATVELDRWGVGSPWSEEASAINVGAEYRKDVVEFDPDAFSEAGDVAGFGEPVFPIHGSIAVKEIFGEARIPLLTGRLVRRLAFEGGFRKSWYTNARSSFASDAHKLALDLTAVNGLRIRVSQQRANRAPNVLELLAPAEADAFNHDPCAGISPFASEEACALTGVVPGQYGHVPEATTNLFEYNAISGGNEGLQPETATTRTIGIVLQPRMLRGFNATIDWWDIRLKGAISKIGAQAIVDNCIASGDPIFCSRIHRDPNGSLLQGDGHVDNRLANLGALKVRGIDGSADYSLPLGRLGTASLGFRGTYVLRWVVDNGGLSSAYDCAGLFGAPCGMQPRWKHTGRATWDPSRVVSLSVQWRHMGGVKLAAVDPTFNLTDQVSPGHATLRAQDYFDIATVVRVRKGLELRLGVNNMLDRQPPLVVGNTAAGDGPYNSNTYPSWYDPLGRYIFASVSVDLKP
jgi:outer membrane receptor protein involved in Fe transport